MARGDYDEQAPVYDRARALPDEAVAVWMATARRHIGPRPGRILDLGAGTGLWSGPLADAHDAPVVAVEPSGGMIARAPERSRVERVCARGEDLPFAEASFGAAWLSAVIHHFDDLNAAATELRRTLKPGAPVLMRGAFPGRGPVGSLDRFFPATARALDTFPTVEATFDAFQRAGFNDLSVEKVTQITAHRLSDVIERVKHRADTALRALTDEEFEHGLAAIERAAATESGPVTDALDLVVVR